MDWNGGFQYGGDQGYDQGFTQQLIAIRMLDGIFVGNSLASHDEDFVESNKVTHIINCAGTETANIFSTYGVKYLTFPWKDTPYTVVLDEQDRTINKITSFIEEADDEGECVLIHSMDGRSRACVVLAAYLIKKFGWGFSQTLQFCALNFPEMNIKPHFLRQLKSFSMRFSTADDIFDPNVDPKLPVDDQQLVLRNTYLNSIPPSEDMIAATPPSSGVRKPRIAFSAELIAPPAAESTKSLQTYPMGVIKKKNGALKTTPATAENNSKQAQIQSLQMQQQQQQHQAEPLRSQQQQQKQNKIDTNIQIHTNPTITIESLDDADEDGVLVIMPTTATGKPTEPERNAFDDKQNQQRAQQVQQEQELRQSLQQQKEQLEQQRRLQEQQQQQLQQHFEEQQRRQQEHQKRLHEQKQQQQQQQLQQQIQQHLQQALSMDDAKSKSSSTTDFMTTLASKSVPTASSAITVQMTASGTPTNKVVAPTTTPISTATTTTTTTVKTTRPQSPSPATGGVRSGSSPVPRPSSAQPMKKRPPTPLVRDGQQQNGANSVSSSQELTSSTKTRDRYLSASTDRTMNGGIARMVPQQQQQQQATMNIRRLEAVNKNKLMSSKLSSTATTATATRDPSTTVSTSTSNGANTTTTTIRQQPDFSSTAPSPLTLEAIANGVASLNLASIPATITLSSSSSTAATNGTSTSIATTATATATATTTKKPSSRTPTPTRSVVGRSSSSSSNSNSNSSNGELVASSLTTLPSQQNKRTNSLTSITTATGSSTGSSNGHHSNITPTRRSVTPSHSRPSSASSFSSDVSLGSNSSSASVATKKKSTTTSSSSSSLSSSLSSVQNRASLSALNTIYSESPSSSSSSSSAAAAARKKLRYPSPTPGPTLTASTTTSSLSATSPLPADKRKLERKLSRGEIQDRLMRPTLSSIARSSTRS